MRCNSTNYGLPPCSTDLEDSRVRQEKDLCACCDELRFFWNASQRLLAACAGIPFWIGTGLGQCPTCTTQTMDMHTLGNQDQIGVCSLCRTIVYRPHRGEACYVV